MTFLTTGRRSAAALGLGAVLGLAACGSSHHSASSTTTSSSTSSTTTSSPSTTSPPSSTSSSTTAAPATTSSTAATAPPGPQPCATSALAGTLTNPSGAAGTTYYTLVLTNKGTGACTLEGYPGVSFLAEPAGTQVGAAAARTPASPRVVTVPSGGTADATLGIGVAGNFANCQMTPVQALRVYPPGQTTSLVIPHDDSACANTADVTLHVGPMVAGS